mmetsp:Transcript_25318/g.59265  ORF Transcript_25318/g.59265 Transcript_25318/m.59265 type:complete len:626 (-) Transcript_25318:980-2857(-)
MRRRRLQSRLLSVRNSKSTLLAVILLSDYLRRSASFFPNYGSISGSHFRHGSNQYHRQEDLRPVKNKIRSFSVLENYEKLTEGAGFDWCIPSSVTDLFDVLEEEEAGNIVGRDHTNDVTGCESAMFDTNGVNDDYDDHNYNKEEKGEEISDAEALLACWSFLKRRKRLGGWNECEERQAQNALSPNYFLTEKESVDIFLDEDDDDEEEDTADDREANDEVENNENGLTFDTTNNHDSAASFITVQDILSASSPIYDKVRFGDDNDDDDDGGVTEDLVSISDSMFHRNGRNAAGDVKNKNTIQTEDIDLWYTQFTSFPEEPSKSRIRRVRAMKGRWEDPAYRKRWYEKRWGHKASSKRKQVQQSDRERNAIQRARALPSGFWGSDELASMTEEEIAYAISSRIQSTRERLASRKETLQRRQDSLSGQMEALETSLEEEKDGNHIHEDTNNPLSEVFFIPARKTLEEEQKKRSARAKKLYGTRLTNQNLKNEGSATERVSSAPLSITNRKKLIGNRGPYFPPKQLTPQDAFLRVEFDLDHGIAPTVDDIRLVLEPGRMKNRKALLRRILRDGFNLRGKCVPPVVSIEEANGNYSKHINYHEEHELEFVTHCTIKRLGSFVISLLEKK